MATVAEKWFMDRVASLGCCVCRRIGHGFVPGQFHHIAEGSGLRSNFAGACLCPEHHTGASGFHKRGRGFLVQFRVPGETEYGLMVWTNEDLAKSFCL